MWYHSQFLEASAASRATWTEETAAERRLPTPPASPLSARLASWFLESLAEYGAAMHPTFVELGEYAHYRDPRLKTPYARNLEPYLEEVAIPWEGRGRPEPVAVPAAAAGRIPVAPRRSWVRRLWSSLREARRLRRTRLALEALDDETLHDIGIARCQIDRVVTHENFY